MSNNGGTTKDFALRQAGLALNLLVFMASIVVLGVVANFFSQMPQLRTMLDATKTRAYALSPQTLRLLDEIDSSGEDWTIAVILVEANADRAMKRQVDEVLRRFTDSSEHITAVHIDPTDADTLDEYESLLAHLRLIYSDKIDAYNAALAPGIEAVNDYELFVEQRSGQLVDLRLNLSADDPIYNDFQQLLGGFSLRTQQITQIKKELAKSLQEDEARPIRDYETARSIFVGALTVWADELYGIELLFAKWRAYPNVDPSIKEIANSTSGQYEQLARKLIKIADPIKFLPELEIGTIGRQIERGEAAIVIGPDGAALIPSGQIFPQVQQRNQTGITFDQRFRGEQIIAAAMRSLLINPMPLVVFVHAEKQSLLQRRSKQNFDLVGPASILKASRFDIKEWIVTLGDRPTPKVGQAVVWIVVPPPIPLRTSFVPSKEEYALIDSVKQLIVEGEMVMLNVAPSGMHKFNQPDPWQTVALAMGVEVDTSKVIFEKQIDQSGQAINLRTARITEFESEHPVSAAAHGLVTSLDLPLAITKATSGPIGFEYSKAAVVKAQENRWLEDDWAIDPSTVDKPNENQFFAEDITVIATTQRNNPVTRNTQRFVVIGSSGWLLSNRSDVVNDMGGGRVALVYPGNYELLLASVAWLSGHDEMIAPSAISQQIQTLSGVTQSVKIRWRWITVVILPCATLLFGSLVWFVRQRS